MALKSQKHSKYQCFRASENPENSAQCAQNAGKTSILHVRSVVQAMPPKTSKITSKWAPKSSKMTPRRLQDGPPGKWKPYKTMSNSNFASKTSSRSPRRPQELPRCHQKAPRSPEEVPQTPTRATKRPNISPSGPKRRPLRPTDRP